MNELRPYERRARSEDRRKGGERRVGHDRREEFRYEPGKEDRRSGRDRRKNSWTGTLLR